MTHYEPEIDPQRASGTFIYGLTQLRVADDGLEPGHQIEIIDVIATLADAVKRHTAAESTPADMLLRRLAMVTLYLGTSTVTAGTTSTGGFQVAANAIVTVPTTGASTEALYGIVASTTANVAFLYPA